MECSFCTAVLGGASSISSSFAHLPVGRCKSDPVELSIAMLGLIHRTILGKGPIQFSAFFQCEEQYNRKLIDPRKACKCPLVTRSALGLVAIYNMLPYSVTGENSVSSFQKRLQGIVLSSASAGHPQWVQVFSPCMLASCNASSYNMFLVCPRFHLRCDSSCVEEIHPQSGARAAAPNPTSRSGGWA